MPSSISSSKQRLPQFPWWRVLPAALCIFLAWVAAMEAALAVRGFQPNLADSAAQWAAQRARADTLGEHALILVGGSRTLQDVDLGSLRRASGLEPVQLGVDGSSFMPVLADLAADPDVRGTVIVDFDPGIVAEPVLHTTSNIYLDYYHSIRGRRLPDFRSSEQWLADMLHSRLRSYADGARPLSSLTARIFKRDPVQQYVFHMPEREEFADYSRAPLPGLYYYRVLKNLRQPFDSRPGVDSDAQVDAELTQRIATLQPVDNTEFLRGAKAIDAMADRIRAHGGRALFLVYPESGFVRDIDDRHLPRPLFWDKFAAGVDAPAVNYEDVPAMRQLQCPDGSHLDYRDRAAFTQAMIGALHLESLGRGGN